LNIQLCRVEDFEVSGDGAHASWEGCAWHPLTRVGGTENYGTRCKMLASATGLYFLCDAEDRVLTCTGLQDNDNLYAEDVFEVFLHPEGSQAVYFEYEISPTNAELPIMVSQSAGRFHGWLPWHYTGSRRVRHATHVRGGSRSPGATVVGWSAEFFIPYSLLAGLSNVPPKPGSSWRANVYRIDYDTGAPTQWAWAPETGGRFHDYWSFGTLVFPE